MPEERFNLSHWNKQNETCLYCKRFQNSVSFAERKSSIDNANNFRMTCGTQTTIQYYSNFMNKIEAKDPILVECSILLEKQSHGFDIFLL